MSNDGYSFVKEQELVTHMNKLGLEADQSKSLQGILDGTQRELERHCQRRFEKREWVEKLEPDEFGYLWPTAIPVASVTQPDDFPLYIDLHGRRLSGYRSALTLAGTPELVEVTYVGGLDPRDPDGLLDLSDVRLGILRVATREAQVRVDDTLNVDDLEARQTKPADKLPLGWQPDELKKFDRLRRRTVAT